MNKHNNKHTQTKQQINTNKQTRKQNANKHNANTKQTHENKETRGQTRQTTKQYT